LSTDQSHIVFFDGVCGLCNRAVDFLLARNHKGVLRFSPLQGNTAKQKLEAAAFQNLDSIVYWREGKIYRKSSAILKIMNDLGGWGKLLVIFWIIPRFIRNFLYDVVAKNRYKWFGKKESCRMPTKEERAYFLD
jgi:predicted DCC family thiol-disulfide oxidoreductase YuxK